MVTAQAMSMQKENTKERQEAITESLVQENEDLHDQVSKLTSEIIGLKAQNKNLSLSKQDSSFANKTDKPNQFLFDEDLQDNPKKVISDLRDHNAFLERECKTLKTKNKDLI